MESNEEFMRTLYAAFNGRDIEGLLARMSPEVDWPNGMEGGRLHGHEEVRSYWRRQWSTVDPHVEPDRIAVDGAGDTVVDVHQVVRNLAGEVLMDRTVLHVYSIRSGLVDRMEIREPETPLVHRIST